MRKLLSILLAKVLIFTSMTSFSEPNVGKSLNPEECQEFEIECSCYGPKTLQKIYEGLIDRKKCREVEKKKKDEFIKRQIVVVPTEPQEKPAWWQEPSVIVSGVVISASLASLLTFYLVKKD